MIEERRSMPLADNDYGKELEHISAFCCKSHFFDVTLQETKRT